MANSAQGTNGYGKGYGKRPRWQWILLYAIIGGLIYFAIYYFYIRKHTHLYGNTSQSQSSASSPSSAGGSNW